MVQCVKRVLRHTVKEVAPSEHVLESFLIEAENIVNSLPLTRKPLLRRTTCSREQLTRQIPPSWMEALLRKAPQRSSGV